MNRSIRYLAALAVVTCFTVNMAEAMITDYSFSGIFSSSKWNADSTNATRTPGGPVSGSFSIDTDTLTVAALEIDTTFYSIHGSQAVVTSGTYNYGIGGTDDLLGTNPTTNAQISGVSSLPLYIPLAVNLEGTYDPDGAGGVGAGSVIQIMDSRVTPSRIYRPRLTIFMEGVDFSAGAPNSFIASVSEDAYNINRGNGVAGYSGSQGAVDLLTVVPETASFSLIVGMLGFCLILRRPRKL